MKTLLFLFSCFLHTALLAQLPAGSLDPEFDFDGKLISKAGTAEGIAVDSDGRIIIAGTTPPGWDYESRILVGRYLPDGTIDSTFSTNAISLFEYTFAEALDVALLPSGKIITAGSVETSPNEYDIALVRLNTDGTLDSSFGENGLAIFNSGFPVDRVFAMAIQDDEKIITAGIVTESGDNENIAVARFNMDGSIDSAFGMDGIVIYDHEGYSDAAYDLIIQADGKLVVTGVISGQIMESVKVVVIRFNNNGSFDNTFGNSGIVTADIETFDDRGFSVVQQDDGRLLVGAIANRGTSLTPMYVAVLRYNSDGTPDLTYGINGMTTIHTSGDLVYTTLLLQPDGKLLAGGSAFTATGDIDFIMARFDLSGANDLSWGNNGFVTQDLGWGIQDYLRGIVLQPNGKLIAAGYSAGFINNVGMMRFNTGLNVGINETNVSGSNISVFPNPYSDEFYEYQLSVG